MAKNWLELPVVWGGFYPQELVTLAEKLEVPVEQIAKDKGVKPNVTRDEFIRRDEVELVYKISGDPDDPNRTLLWEIDGNILLIAMEPKKVMQKVDRFLGPDGYIFHKRAIQLTMEPVLMNPEEEEDEDESREN